MTEQPQLFGPTTDPTAELTERQRHAYQQVCATPGGAGADEVGAAWHEHRGKHGRDDRCQWCAKDGASVLRSKALAPLVTRRRGGSWQPRNRADAASSPDQGGQVVELPGTRFEDIFGDAA